MLNSNSTIYQTIRPSDLISNLPADNPCMTSARRACHSLNSDRKIKAYLYQIAERFDVVLKKSSQGFGLTLVDDLVIDSLKLLKVKAIYKDGPAAKNGVIQPGDILSAFNQIDIIGVQPDEVIKMFKVIKEKESIILTVWKIVQKPRIRHPHNNNYEIINFYLQKNEGGFGFILGNCKDEHQVAKVNGSGDVQLLLQTNDRIACIGRVRIDHLPHDQVVNLLKKFPKNHFLHFTIIRDLSNLTRSFSNESCHNMDYSMNSSIYSKISKNTESHFYGQIPRIGTSGPCNTPDFIPATHFLSLNRSDSSKLFQQNNFNPTCQIPPSFSTPNTTLIADIPQQPDFIPDSFTESSLNYSQNPEFISVQLTRSPSKGFGFRLMGGSEEGCQVYIGAIIPNGPVDQCGVIQCGDVITEINNVSTEMKTHSDVVNMLDEAAKSRNGKLSLTLKRNPSISGEPKRTPKLEDCRNVVLSRNAEEEFGFVIVSAVNPTEPCGIGRINPGSVAEKCGQLHLGDRILSVNGHNLQGLHYKDVLQIIKHSDTQIQLTVRDGDINRLKTIKYELPRYSEPEIQYQEKSDSIPPDVQTQPISIMKSSSQFDKQLLRSQLKSQVGDEGAETSDKLIQDTIYETTTGDPQTPRDPLLLLAPRR